MRNGRGPHRACSLPAGLPRDHYIQAAWQRPEFGGQRIPRLAPHDDRATQCGALEMRHVFWQAPGQGTFDADDAIGGAGEDDV
jgi:hypothetical protein